jgi:hypothetical protein
VLSVVELLRRKYKIKTKMEKIILKIFGVQLVFEAAQKLQL